MRDRLLSVDRWLTDIIGKPAFRLDGDFSQGLPEAFAQLTRPAFVDACVPTSDFKAAKVLRRSGFELVDTLVRLEGTHPALPATHPALPATHPALPATHPALPATTGGEDVGLARPEEKKQVADLAARSFQYSRFHSDPRFPRAVADRIKSEWAAGYFDGCRGDMMVVARCDGRVAGFFQCIVQSDHLHIDLYAVDPDFRRRGLAKSMLEEAVRHAQPSRISLGTQIVNIPSINLFVGMGFTIYESKHIFHAHLESYEDRKI